MEASNDLRTLYIMGLGCAVLVGLLSPRKAFRAVGRLLVIALLAPIALAHVQALPPVVLIVGGAVLAWFAMRKLLRLFVGEHAEGEVLGGVVLGALRLPFRLVGALWRAVVRRREPPVLDAQPYAPPAVHVHFHTGDARFPRGRPSQESQDVAMYDWRVEER